MRRSVKNLVLEDRVIDGKYRQGTAERMVQLRQMIMFHSYMYYVMNMNFISDHQYDAIAMELARLNEEYPELKSQGTYSEHFMDWNGDTSTGFNLPLTETEINNKMFGLYLTLNAESHRQGK